MRIFCKTVLPVIVVFAASTEIVVAGDVEAGSEDTSIMQQCIEAVRDVNAGLSPGQQPANRRQCIGAASARCMARPDGASTIGMVECINRETNWWDGQLNSHYQFLKENLDTPLFDALRDVQRKWIAYKDANCRFEYDSWGGGSIRQPATASCFLDITAIRALELGELVDRIGYR